MDKSILLQRITAIQKETSRLNNALSAMRVADVQMNPENYEALSANAALQGERIACRLRHLLYAFTSVKKQDYLISAATAQGVEINYEDDVLTVTLPCLLPKRQKRQSCEFLIDPINAALSQYAQNYPMPQFRHCVVCFSHIYCQNQSDGRIRDYDNLELKQLLDVVGSFSMVDDSGLLCDVYHTTEMGETDCTRIFIMPQKQFPAWLQQRQAQLKSASHF